MLLPAVTDDPQRWRLDAACREADVRLFFDDGQRYRGDAGYREARAYCERCTVIADCTEFIMDAERGAYRIGYVAGMTPAERRAHAKETA